MDGPAVIAGHFDVVVVGAGIGGINAAYRIQTNLPSATYTILEGRSALGGTWDLFKYPGIRSDSDLHTFGFPFNPWQKPNPIATGASIVEYINETASKFGIDRKIQFKHRVVSAGWSSHEQRWRLDVDNEGARKTYYAKFVIMATGYYSYDKPLQADIPGLDRFKGTRVHPQFWPQHLDYKGKKMVVIGSGASAITIMPAVVDGGVGSVTMLQRSPSYIMSMPQKKLGEKSWYDYFPRWIGLRLVRFQFIVVAYLLFQFCRRWPERAKKILPSGRATIVTDTIKSVVEDGIELTSGEKLDADIVVTATGLSLQLCGNIAITVDKEPVNFPDCYLWRSSMLTGVPNLGVIIGYVNASWTLGSDTASRLFTRLIKLMDDNKYTSATPHITPEEAKDPQLPFDLASTYVKQALGKKLMPHAGKSGPWLPRDNYFKDDWNANYANLRQGLIFKV